MHMDFGIWSNHESRVWSSPCPLLPLSGQTLAKISEDEVRANTPSTVDRFKAVAAT